MVTVEMEDVTHIGPAGDELSARRLDVRDDEEHAVSGTRHARRVQMDRRWRSGRCQLHRSKLLPDHEIGVETPPQLPVEGLGAIDVGYRDGDDLELQIDRRSGAVFMAHLCAAHCDLRDL